MPVNHSRLFVVGIFAALIAGCGGGGTTTGGGGGNGNGSGNGSGAGNNSTTVTVTFSGTLLPAAVAASIGTGAFTSQTLSGNTLSLSIPNGTSNYAVAAVCSIVTAGVSSSQSEFVWEASIADGTSPTLNCYSAPGQTGTLTGNLDATAIPGAQYFHIDSLNGLNLTSESSSYGQSLLISLPAPVGSDRVLVLALNSAGSVLAVKNFDNQTVPGTLNGGNTVVFSATDEITSEAIAYNNRPSGYSNPVPYASVDIGGVEAVSLSSDATTTYPALPASAIENGDVYAIGANASAQGSTFTSQVYAKTKVSGGPVSLTQGNRMNVKTTEEKADEPVV